MCTSGSAEAWIHPRKHHRNLLNNPQFEAICHFETQAREPSLGVGVAVEIRSSLVGQGRTRALVNSLCPCPAKAQATRHVVLQLDARFRVTRTIGSANWTCNPPRSNCFRCNGPEKQQWTRHAHTILHIFWTLATRSTRVQHAAGGGRQVSGRGGQVSSKCRRRAVHRPSEDWKPGGVG